MDINNIRVMEVPPYILVPDALTYFGIKAREAWNLIAQKKINAVKYGKLWKIETASIFKFYKKYQSIKGGQE